MSVGSLLILNLNKSKVSLFFLFITILKNLACILKEIAGIHTKVTKTILFSTKNQLFVRIEHSGKTD